MPRHVAAAQIVPQRVVVVLLHRDDPHVDAVVAHRARQHLLELIEADLALHFPAAAGFLCVRWQDLQQDDRERDQEAHRVCPIGGVSPIYIRLHHGRGFGRRYTAANRLWRTYIPHERAHATRPVAGDRYVCRIAAGLASAQTPQDGGIDYDTARDERRLQATQAQGPITLDGRLDEASWAAAPLATGSCRTIRARASRRPTTPRSGCSTTIARSTSACSPRIREPGEIIVNELRKDFNTGNADGFQVVIDTFHDERNGYQFAINPGGAKWDSQMSNEGRDQNANWDGIWDVGTRIGEDGWYAEIEIPFKTLKFGPEDAADLGHQLPAPAAPPQREQLLVAAAPHPPVVARLDGRHATKGLQGLTPGANVRVKPYALANLEQAGGRGGSTRTTTPAST